MTTTLGSLAILYSSQFLYAGYAALGAAWVSSFIKYGGPVRGGDGGGYPPYEGYGYPGYGAYDFGGYGGYGGLTPGGYGGGFGYGDDFGYDFGDSYSKGKGCRKKCKSRRRKRDINLSVREDITSMAIRELETILQDNGMISWRSGTNINEPQEEHLLRLIRLNDRNNCSLRMVCEVAAVNDRPLTRYEWEIMQFIKNGDSLFERRHPGNGVRSNSPVLAEYKAVAEFGSRGGNCAREFRRCPVTARTMMKQLTLVRRHMRL